MTSDVLLENQSFETLIEKYCIYVYIPFVRKLTGTQHFLQMLQRKSLHEMWKGNLSIVT